MSQDSIGTARLNLVINTSQFDAAMTAVKRNMNQSFKGVEQAYAAYQKRTSDVAGDTKEVFGKVFRGMEDAAVQFANTGKLSFSDLARSAVADLVRIPTRAALSGALGFMGQGVVDLMGGKAWGGNGETPQSLQSGTRALRENQAERGVAGDDRGNARSSFTSEWFEGIKQAFTEFQSKAVDVAGDTEKVFDRVFRGMEDAAVQFATTGKLSFSDLARSAIADLARIQARAAISGVLGFIGQTVVGLVGGALGGAGTAASGAGGLNAAANAGSLTAGSGLGLNTKGFSFGGLRAAGGDVRPGKFYEVNEQNPELYTQGNRTWLIAGDDPGYVSPLMKGAGAGADSAASGPINIQTNVYSDGRADTNVAGGDSGLGERLTEGIKALVQQEMAKSYRQGGMGWNARNGRS